MRRSPPEPKPRASKKAPPKRERLDTEDRRAQLLALGLKTFGSRPYDDVSIDGIAQSAGISKGLLYHYFPTKRAFYEAAVGLAAQRLLDETRPDPSVPPLERGIRGLNAYLDFVERHGSAYVTLMRSAGAAGSEVAEIVDRTRLALLGRVLEANELKKTCGVRLAIRGWIGFVEATSLDWAESRSVERDALVGLWIRMLVAALE